MLGNRRQRPNLPTQNRPLWHCPNHSQSPIPKYEQLHFSALWLSNPFRTSPVTVKALILTHNGDLYKTENFLATPATKIYSGAVRVRWGFRSGHPDVRPPVLPLQITSKR